MPIEKLNQSLEIGEKYLVGAPEFLGIWVCVDSDEKNYIFIPSPKRLSGQITELHIPKEGITINGSNGFGRLSKVLGKDHYLVPRHLDKDRERFLELAEKGGILIQN